MIPEFVHFQKFEIIVIIWLAFSAVADCAITVALVWHLVSGVLYCSGYMNSNNATAQAQDRIRRHR